MLAVAVAALIDWFTGPDVQVLLFDLVPVLTATWFVGWSIGVVVVSDAGPTPTDDAAAETEAAAPRRV